MVARLSAKALSFPKATATAAEACPTYGLHRQYSYEANLDTVNGTHLAADVSGFLEKRRKGLVRFANALVQHPVLNQEQLVQMFLSVPTVGCSPYVLVLARLTLTSVPGAVCLA